MNYELANYGSVFSTRDRGIRLLADLYNFSAAAGQPMVRIDFTGVHSITSSFADEFVGKLAQHAHDQGGEMPELLNMSSEVEAKVERTLGYRGLGCAPIGA